MFGISEKKICFMLLVHEKRHLVIELLNNIKHYCPNSSVVLYNGGSDKSLCEGLDVPVCPTSKKLNHGFTTIHFLEVMEWLDQINFPYDYLINIDSDAIFIREGYEEFIYKQMKDTDYMGIDYRGTGHDYYCAQEIRKEQFRWAPFFNFEPLYGVFNVGQVMSHKFIKVLLANEQYPLIKKAMIDTKAFGTDEIIFANLVTALGFKAKKYPGNVQNPKYKTIGYDMNRLLVRYRPHIKIPELITALNQENNTFFVHPVVRSKTNPTRNFINDLQKNFIQYSFRDEMYPWFHENAEMFSVSKPIINWLGFKELVAREQSTLTHYFEDKGQWYKTVSFTDSAIGTPFLLNSRYDNYEVIARLKEGGLAHWWRNNDSKKLPWSKPTIITKSNIEPVFFTQLENGKLCIVGKMEGEFVYMLRDDRKTWRWSDIKR